MIVSGRQSESLPGRDTASVGWGRDRRSHVPSGRRRPRAPRDPAGGCDRSEGRRRDASVAAAARPRRHARPARSALGAAGAVGLVAQVLVHHRAPVRAGAAVGDAGPDGLRRPRAARPAGAGPAAVSDRHRRPPRALPAAARAGRAEAEVRPRRGPQDQAGHRRGHVRLHRYRPAARAARLGRLERVEGAGGMHPSVPRRCARPRPGGLADRPLHPGRLHRRRPFGALQRNGGRQDDRAHVRRRPVGLHAPGAGGAQPLPRPRHVLRDRAPGRRAWRRSRGRSSGRAT